MYMTLMILIKSSALFFTQICPHTVTDTQPLEPRGTLCWCHLGGWQCKSVNSAEAQGAGLYSRDSRAQTHMHTHKCIHTDPTAWLSSLEFLMNLNEVETQKARREGLFNRPPNKMLKPFEWVECV